jgi:hypothetical protein
MITRSNAFVVCFSTIFLFIISASTCKEKTILVSTLKGNPILNKYYKNYRDYEIQIRYTQINRDANNFPSFESFEFNVDNEAYFYPASTIKMPIAFLALQRINELKNECPEINTSTPMLTQAGSAPQKEYLIDELNYDNPPNVEEYIKQIFVVSDNNANNRLFELLGANYINNQLKNKGIFTNSRIIHRVGVGGFDAESNKMVNPISFIINNCDIKIPERKSVYEYRPVQAEFKGRGYMNSDEKIVDQPFDFSNKNFYSIRDLEATLMRVTFPEIFAPSQRFNYTDADYKFIYKTLDLLPRDVPYYASDSSMYDAYVKYFIKGDNSTKIPSNIHIFNKVGWAYGTLTDCSYIFDTSSGAEFFLTATILVNRNKIFNDGKYEYESEGIPFFNELGAEMLKYEQKRVRKVRPDFSKFISSTK